MLKNADLHFTCNQVRLRSKSLCRANRYIEIQLLVQHLRDLEAEAEAKGGIQQVLADHFSKVYKVSMFQAA